MADKKLLKAKLDLIFKKLFCENMDLLQQLLSGLLDISEDSIKNIQVRNGEILPEDITKKFIRLDLNMEVDGKLINAEIQFRRDPNFKDRSLMYWAKLYSGELESGEEYCDLKESITINIVNFSVFKCEEYHSHFTVMEKTRHEVLTDKCGIHYFELKKIAKIPNKNSMMELWLQLINAETKEEFEMLKQTNVAPIQKAIHIIYEMSEDEKIQEMARMREKALHDEASALGDARREGNYEGRIGVARNLIEIGLSIEQIEKATSLTREEIEAL